MKIERALSSSRICMYGVIAVLSGYLCVPSTVIASSIVFQDGNITTDVGDTFSLPVSIDPLGEKQYTVQFALAYPPDMLEVAAFAFADDWLPLSQPGYDFVNNVLGSFVKTAGYPTGFSVPAPFGTVTFRTKKAGQATITVGSQTLILNAENKSTLESMPVVLVSVISSPTSVFTSPVEPSEESVSEPASIVPIPAESSQNLPFEEQNLFDVSAGAASVIPSHTTRWVIPILILGVAVGFVAVMIFERWRRRRILARKIV